jgi:hypothetical protein
MGALLGGLGGEFSVTTVPAPALHAPNVSTPGAPAQTSRPETVGATVPERTPTAVGGGRGC